MNALKFDKLRHRIQPLPHINPTKSMMMPHRLMEPMPTPTRLASLLLVALLALALAVFTDSLEFAVPVTFTSVPLKNVTLCP
ncbi:hypothetical protein E2P81_ATG01998 [Venturia nashicola]|nr:hypothetical protein E2P81_ATG01998 [Venturia nashicola]